MNSANVPEQPFIEGLFVFEHKPNVDARGFFEKLFSEEALKPALAGQKIVQVNRSFNSLPGTVRGLHFQRTPFSETKIVTCIKGAIQDVVVDIRKGSPSFLQNFTIELSEQNNLSLVIPAGFAHGFQSLLPNTELIYFHTEEHRVDAEGGLNILDPMLGINWPLEVVNLSDRDKSYKFLQSEFEGL